MSLSAVVFSPDKIRGALLRTVLKKNGFEVALYKNLNSAQDVLKKRMPSLVILDKDGYFRNELEQFFSLNGPLKNISILVVANSADDRLVSSGKISVEWCLSSPLDPLLVLSKAVSLLSLPRPDEKETADRPQNSSQAEEKTEFPENEEIARDLIGYLGIK